MTPISGFEERVACVRIAHGPGLAEFLSTALGDLSPDQQQRVVTEAAYRNRSALIDREIDTGLRPDYQYFLNNFAAALLRLPDADRGRRLRRCPKVLREGVMPLIAEYEVEARRLLAGAGLAGPETIPVW